MVDDLGSFIDSIIFGYFGALSVFVLLVLLIVGFFLKVVTDFLVIVGLAVGIPFCFLVSRRELKKSSEIEDLTCPRCKGRGEVTSTSKIG